MTAGGEHVREGLVAAGWTGERLLWMVLRPDGDRRGATYPAQTREGGLEDIRPLAERWHGGWNSREAARAVVDADARSAAKFGLRGFVAEREGELGAYATLLLHEGIGEIDQVYTAPEHRGHGLASVVVRAAIAAAIERGDDLVVIGADADDWPQQLYERLGFETVGSRHGFVRPSV